MASIQAFHADAVDPRMSDFTPIPEGVYKLEVTESDNVPTKAGDGEIIKLTYRVLEGEHEGATIWHNINYINKSPKAQEIGQREFSALCHAVGELSVTETEQLHFKPFTAKVGIETASGHNPTTQKPYPAKNKIVKIFWDGAPNEPPAGASASPPPTAVKPPQATPAAVATRTPPAGRPWGKK